MEAQSAPQRDSLPRKCYLYAPLTGSKELMVLQARPAPTQSPINIFTPGALIWQLAREMMNNIELVNEAILSKPCIKLIGNFVCPATCHGYHLRANFAQRQNNITVTNWKERSLGPSQMNAG